MWFCKVVNVYTVAGKLYLASFNIDLLCPFFTYASKMIHRNSVILPENKTSGYSNVVVATSKWRHLVNEKRSRRVTDRLSGAHVT